MSTVRNHPEVTEVRNLLLRAINEKGPEYIYPDEERGASRDPFDLGMCHYVYDGRPSCLIGHILAYAGVPIEDLQEREGGAASEIVAALGPWNESIVARALNFAQEAQDNGLAWADALEAFDQAVRWQAEE